METELICIYESRKTFYGKAKVITDSNITKLKSYSTIVCQIENGKPLVFGTYSNTTLRHIKEFLKQNGFKAETSKQILKDYSPSEEEKREELKREEKEFNSFSNSLKMICAFGDVMNKETKDKNEFKKRMLNAGLKNKGLSFPEDWNELSEAEKEKRLSGAIEQL